MAKKRMLITAGPTREMLDPIRYLSNHSTGEMGYALARAAYAKGYQVTLVSGPTALTPPQGVRFVPVVSAKSMAKECRRYFFKSDVLIMSAAVCDFTPVLISRQKIRRQEPVRLVLKKTSDILAGLARKKGERRVIGFCLETQNWIRNAKLKLRNKKLDGIVANYCRRGYVPFGDRPVRVAFIDKTERVQLLPSQTKDCLAHKLLSWIEQMG